MIRDTQGRHDPNILDDGGPFLAFKYVHRDRKRYKERHDTKSERDRWEGERDTESNTPDVREAHKQLKRGTYKDTNIKRYTERPSDSPVQVEMALIQLLADVALVLVLVCAVARVHVVAQLVGHGELLATLAALELGQRARVDALHVHVQRAPRAEFLQAELAVALLQATVCGHSTTPPAPSIVDDCY